MRVLLGSAIALGALIGVPIDPEKVREPRRRPDCPEVSGHGGSGHSIWSRLLTGRRQHV
jgi:hypothetical protein